MSYTDGAALFSAKVRPRQLTKVDLHKEDVSYEPLEAEVEFSELNEESWSGAGMELDSAVRAKGAKYVWTYRGLWAAG